MTRTNPANCEVELDLGRYALRRRGRTVRLARKPMELLIFLVARREQLVSRQDIVLKIWQSDLFVDTESNINNMVRKIRAALGDNQAKPRFLETVVGKGYRFIGPIRVIDARFPQSELIDGASASSKRNSSAESVDRPSLAILPLQLLGNIADDQGVSLGFADALVSRLGNLQGVDVMPATATLNLPANMTAAEIGARLGVRFVVRGAIRGSGRGTGLSLELFDTRVRREVLTRKCAFDFGRLPELEDDIAMQIAKALHRPLGPAVVHERVRYSKDPMAYADFVRGFRLSTSGDAAQMDEATSRLTNAVTRDPDFALAHANLSLVCAKRHFEHDPSNVWLEKAEFHCRRALEVDPDLAEGHVAKAFLLWGPSKNFQHLDAIAELRRALALQKNLPNAYSRLGTILAHIGLLDHARAMYERGSAFHPEKKISHSILQVYMWSGEYDLAHEEIQAWRKDSPGNKYALYFAPQLAMMSGDWREAKALLEEGNTQLPEDPLIVSLQGLYHAMRGKSEPALECMARACGSARSFGHAHHTYYQVACTLAVLERRQAAFEWLERSVGNGFACWPFFLKDSCLDNLRQLPEFEVLISSLQAKYPDHLGIL